MQEKIMLFLRRYGLTIIYVIGFFCFIYAINKVINLLLSHRLYCALILALNIRLLDDILDYEKDVFQNKILFKKNTLIILYSISVILNIILGILFKDILLLILLVLINGICLIKKYEYLKILIMPLFIVYAIYTLDIKILNFILLIVSVLIAILYFYINKNKNKI